MSYEDLLNQIVQKSDNNIIMFLIVFGCFSMLALIAVFTPMYRLQFKERQERLKNENERQSQLITVITANTKAITELQGTLKSTNEINNNTLVEIKNSIGRVHERIDDTADKDDANDIKNGIQEIDSDIKKIFQYIKITD